MSKNDALIAHNILIIGGCMFSRVNVYNALYRDILHTLH